MVGCIFCYALLRNDQHAVDQKWRVGAAVMHDCMKQKVKITIFHAKSIDL